MFGTRGIGGGVLLFPSTIVTEVEEIIYCPVLRNTVSCFPSIGLTAIKNLTKISTGQCFGD